MYRFEQLIVEGKFEEALVEVREMCRQSDRNCDSEVLHFLSRFKELENRKFMGLLDNKEYILELNNLRYGILGFTYNLIDTSLTGNSQNSLSIEKNISLSLSLIFRRIRTGEDFTVKTNSNMLVRDFSRQLLFSFGFDIRDNRLIKEDFIQISLYKQNAKKESLCEPHTTLKESGLVEGDTIFIKFEPSKSPAFLW